MSVNKPIPSSYTEAANLLGRRDILKVAHNTYLVRYDYTIGIVYHATTVVTYYSDGSIVLTSGGWRTVTTKKRLNWALNRHGYTLHSVAGRWYVSPCGDWATRYVFADGLTLDSIGQIQQETCGEVEHTADQRLKARLQRFAKLCADSLPLDLPSGGDCWYCFPATADNPQTLGDAIGDTAHLESHIDEGYVVPSLVYNALKESGAGPAYYWGAFKGDSHSDQWAELARHQVKRSAYCYLLKRYGFGR